MRMSLNDVENNSYYMNGNKIYFVFGINFGDRINIFSFGIGSTMVYAGYDMDVDTYTFDKIITRGEYIKHFIREIFIVDFNECGEEVNDIIEKLMVKYK